jgi:hypothetical protein
MSEPNPMTDLENQLRSWTPRPPSAKLERRLFAAGLPGCPAEVTAPAWHWLAPVLGCCVVLLVLMNERPLPRVVAQESGGEGGWSGPFPSPKFRQISLEHNLFAVFRAPSLRWTNGGESPLTTGSFLLLKTNGF